MTRFEPQTSGVGSDRSTKWSTNNHRPKSLVTLLPNWLTNWFEPADVIWDVEFWFGRLKNCFSAHNKSSKWNKKCRPVTWRRAKDKTSFWRKQCNGGVGQKRRNHNSWFFIERKVCSSSALFVNISDVVWTSYLDMVEW